MKKILIALIILAATGMSANAQHYQTALGLRGGLNGGITLKHFLGETTAVEGILATRYHGFYLTGLFEIQNPAFGCAQLDWYYGFGGHVGQWQGYSESPWFKDDGSYTVIGVDGIIGLDYTFDAIPLNLSLDYKPAFNLVGYSGFWGDDISLSVRYAFK